MPHKRMKRFRLLLDHLARIEHQLLSGLRDSMKVGSLWGMMRGVGGVRKSIDQSWLAKGLGLGLLCWGFKGVQQQIPTGEASTLQIGQWHFYQDNVPVHNPILVTDYLTKMGIRQFLTSLLFRPCPLWLFGYSQSSETVVMGQLRRWKRLWRRSLTQSHMRTSMGFQSCWNGTTSALLPEEITSKETRVSCVHYQ